jgi:hypothetical protein
MAILRPGTRNFHSGCLAISLAVVLTGCSSPRQETPENSAACSALSKTLTDQEQAFVARAQAIRAEHVLLQDYDRQMIAEITERRNVLQATKLTELSVSDEVEGCSGKQLDDLRYRAQQELANLRSYLNDFNRALKTDPAGVFIDAP